MIENVYHDPIWWRKHVRKGDWVLVEFEDRSKDEGYPTALFEVKAMHPHGVEPSIFVIEAVHRHSSYQSRQIKRVIEIRRSQIEHVELQIDPIRAKAQDLEDDDGHSD